MTEKLLKNKIHVEATVVQCNMGQKSFLEILITKERVKYCYTRRSHSHLLPALTQLAIVNSFVRQHIIYQVKKNIQQTY